jgi:subtilisin family serine protease
MLITRLMQKYPKPFLVPGSNSPGLGVIGELASALGGIGIGAYQGYDSYRVNAGVLPARRDNLHVVGSGGPGGDGALKPDVLSPSQILSSELGYLNPDEGFSSNIPGLYKLPAGYTIGGGTSTATPVASGSIALLLTAAKQTGL